MHQGYELPKEEWPEALQGYKEVSGVCLAACVSGIPWVKGVSAHAHHISESFQGWICLSRSELLYFPMTLKHELAHLLSRYETETHGDQWRAKVLELGGTLSAYSIPNSNIFCKSYHKNKVRRWLSN